MVSLITVLAGGGAFLRFRWPWGAGFLRARLVIEKPLLIGAKSRGAIVVGTEPAL